MTVFLPVMEGQSLGAGGLIMDTWKKSSGYLGSSAVYMDQWPDQVDVQEAKPTSQYCLGRTQGS
jgi:hypothetical protein